MKFFFCSFQRLLKQTTSHGIQRTMNISTDAISLDGLLDSVSSGSFSDLPSPNDLKSKAQILLKTLYMKIASNQIFKY